MREPKPADTPINMQRYAAWREEFSGYRHSITENRIERWLKQFKKVDRDLAARILDAIDFITYEQIATAFKSILHSLDGWDREEKNREGKWRFVAFSTSAGQSGDTMLYRFRRANGLNGRKYNKLFIHMSDLLREELGSNDTVVFVDDFSGTGKQVANAWEEFIQELLPSEPKVYLVLVVACHQALDNISRNTDLEVYPYIDLGNKDNLFDESCAYFDDAEKQKLLKYCSIANKSNPKGFGDSGLLLTFAHTCPNNSIPILHTSHSKWEGLFRRYD